MKQSKKNVAKSVGYSFLSLALASATLVPAVAIATESGEAVLPTGGPDKAKESGSASTAPENPASKDETVYVYTKADGSVKNVEVRATLKNGDDAAELADSSNLSGIEVDEGDGVYSGSPSSMVWSANGGDVTYKGATDAAAPIEVSVTYTLDGKQVSPEELAGKSGHVVVRYDYANNSKETVEVNGASQEVYTPFVAVTAVLLDGDVFSNVSATNGRIVEDGDRTIVVGYAMPGLEESLDLSGNDIAIPGYFEFEADAKNFALKSTLTMASPNLFDDMDLDFNTSELSDVSGSLTQAMGQIVNGSSELTDAIEKISEAANAVSEGSSALAGQSSALPSSARQLASGAQGVSVGIAQVLASAQELDKGLLQVIGSPGGGTAEASGLAGAAAQTGQLKQVANTLYESLKASAGSLGSSSLQTQSTSSNSELSNLADRVANEAAANQSAMQDVQNTAGQVAVSASQAQADASAAQAALQSVNLSSIEDAAVRAQVQAQLDAASASLSQANGSAQAAADAAASLQAASSTIDTSAATEAASAFGAVGSGTLSAQGTGDTSAVTGSQEQIAMAKTLLDGLTALESGLNQAVEGLSTIEQMVSGKMLDKSGLPALANGAAQVAQGASALSNQAPALVGGMGQLASGTKDLAGALGALATGSQELTSGLQQFSDQGISALASALDSKLVRPLTRFDAVAQAGRDYKNFSGITEGTKGSVKFVFETDSIG